MAPKKKTKKNLKRKLKTDPEENQENKKRLVVVPENYMTLQLVLVFCDEYLLLKIGIKKIKI
jgi:hypothetical protein